MKLSLKKYLPQPIDEQEPTKPSDVQAEKIQQVAQGKLPTPHQVSYRVQRQGGQRGR